MEKRIFMKNDEQVELEIVSERKKDKTTYFVMVDGCKIPLNKNGLTKEFMKTFVSDKDKNTRLWYVEICRELTTIKMSDALKKNCKFLNIEKLRDEFINKFELGFIYYKKESKYQTYIDELTEDLFKPGELTEEELQKISA